MVIRSPKRRLTIQERFEQTHAEHPEIYAEFVRLAGVARRSGYKRYSADGIFHVIRFQRMLAREHAVDMRPGEEFKVSNDLISRYVRMFLAEHPDFTGFFEVRKLRTE